MSFLERLSQSLAKRVSKSLVDLQCFETFILYHFISNFYGLLNWWIDVEIFRLIPSDSLVEKYLEPQGFLVLLLGIGNI